MNDSLQPSATERVRKIFQMLINLKRAKSNAEICLRCGINRNYLYELCKGKFCVSSEVAEKLIATFDVSREYVYNGVGKMFATATSTARNSQPSPIVAQAIMQPITQPIPQSPAPDSCTSAEVAALKSEVAALKAQIAALISTNAMLVQMLSQKGEGVAVCTQKAQNTRRRREEMEQMEGMEEKEGGSRQ